MICRAFKPSKPIWWYHTDHLGSSTYLTDNFGRPSHYYETLPFGEMMVEHNQSTYYKDPYPTTNTGTYDNKYKFNGKELDDATQMYYYGARYYDPRTSIFVSVDPLMTKYPNYTPYHYVHQNPINLIDPTGMEADDFRVKKEGKHHTIETTIHTYGDLSSEQAAAQIQKKYADLNKNTPVGDNGETMSFSVLVKHHDSKESAIKAVKDTPGDNLLELTKNIDIDNVNLYDVSKLKSTEHNLDIGKQGGFAITGGREGKAGYPNDGVHEIGHFFGLNDRYETSGGYPFSPAPFTNDIMGSNTPREINSAHYQNIYNHISNEKNEYSTQDGIRIYRDIGRIQENDRKK